MKLQKRKTEKHKNSIDLAMNFESGQGGAIRIGHNGSGKTMLSVIFLPMLILPKPSTSLYIH